MSKPRIPLREQIREQRGIIEGLHVLIAQERARRVAAQRGLVSYMKEHGLGHRIGYNPDADPIVQEAIQRGEIPAPQNLT